MIHWLPGLNSPLNTTWLMASRSIERSSACRTFADWLSGPFALSLPTFSVDALIAKLDRRRQFQPRVGANILDVGREHALDQIESAGFQIGEPHRGVDDRQEHDAVDEDVVLIPVVGEFLEHHAILLHALDELVRTGADRTQPQLVAGFFGRFGRHHHAGAVGELRDQGREWRLQDQLDGEGSTTSA